MIFKPLSKHAFLIFCFNLGCGLKTQPVSTLGELRPDIRFKATSASLEEDDMLEAALNPECENLDEEKMKECKQNLKEINEGKNESQN